MAPVRVSVNPNTHKIKIACYSGCIEPEYQQAECIEQLQNLASLLVKAPAEVLSEGADRVIKLPISFKNQTLTLAVKIFKRQSRFKDFFDKYHKTKAERSFLAAKFLNRQHINSPKPIAYLDHWHNNRLLESYYICLYQEAVNFRDELSQLYWNDPDNAKVMAMLQTVAPAVRAMHDAGFMHGDMGNQNILLNKTDDGLWQNPQFIDLNRGKILPALSWKQRAYDLSRLTLPGEYLKIFKHIYCHHQDIPEELNTWERRFRARFERHSRSRIWRHPIRSFKNRHKVDPHPVYPAPNNLWLWDEKSAQACILLNRQEKKRYRQKTQTLALIWQTLCAAPSIYLHYRQMLKQSYRQSVAMQNRIGLALQPKSEYIEHELSLLAELGNPPVLIRFCHHESQADWDSAIVLIRKLQAQGISIMAAFLQDRRAITEPRAWQYFLEYVIPKIAELTDYIEIAHAINRVKWGIWTTREYRELVIPALTLQARYSNIRLSGPAGIDFEYPYIVAALNEIPKGHYLSALSHHLYVDRRGAPENKQGAFSTLEKCALLKAIAKWSKRCEDKVIISEVNWPLKNTGIYSPIGSPYEAPEWARNSPGVNEQDYSDYMLRYLAISLCSGHIDRVYWWRLSAHGFGLIDDKDNWRKRPAFSALRFFLKTLGSAHFIRKLDSAESVYLLEFYNATHKIIMAWTSHGYSELPAGLECKQAYDNQGNSLQTIQLSGSPCYLLSSL
ncbi:MAG: lipopolysaccharide kinase InaA family protein [Gammaproteobacteria bacterium]|nr:lipopolysaccharide kinase InaA family protein [Gammaproteobacteria bacterium]